jgi:hypothetical protein
MQELFSRTGVRYEVALDVIGACIAHFAEGIAAELEKTTPDPVARPSARRRLRRWDQIRERGSCVMICV